MIFPSVLAHPRSSPGKPTRLPATPQCLAIGLHPRPGRIAPSWRLFLPNLAATVDLIYKANGTFNRGTSMTNRITKPKAFLRGQDLIGFAWSTGNGDQIPRRASSAKLHLSNLPIAELPKSWRCTSPREKSERVTTSVVGRRDHASSGSGPCARRVQVCTISDRAPPGRDSLRLACARDWHDSLAAALHALGGETIRFRTRFDRTHSCRSGGVCCVRRLYRARRSDFLR